jgi:hypothetical protein
MKLNTKDLIGGGLLLLIAVVGYWLNLDHTLGTPRRMGPGYMPMLTFWLLGGLGAFVVVAGVPSAVVFDLQPLRRKRGVQFFTDNRRHRAV